MPVAGRMRPKTSWSGIFRTKRSNPLSVSRLTSIFVPKPKNAFQSPGVQIAGFVLLISPLLFSIVTANGGYPSAARIRSESEELTVRRFGLELVRFGVDA